MKPLRGAVWGAALLLMAATAAPTPAAWCNVFQVCWHRRQAPASTSFYVAPAPCCDPCPQPICTTRYIQRCYYQPVTSYQTKSYYEPVTTYRTSYYYEPVASYRYSCYYDPCTCSYQQVACPTTSYQLRSQCCPVQSWVQRCMNVPVTSYQQSFYWEPVTSCCAPAPCSTTNAVPGADYGTLSPSGNVTVPPPGASDPRIPAQPGISEYPNRNPSESLPYNRYYNAPADSMPPASGSSYRQLPPRTATPLRQPPPAPPPPSVKIDRIVSIGGPDIHGASRAR